MGRSPFLKAVLFWSSFYAWYQYSGRDPFTNRQNYPSYAIFKEKIIKDTWNYGFDSKKIGKDFDHFSMAFKEEIKALFR